MNVTFETTGSSSCGERKRHPHQPPLKSHGQSQTHQIILCCSLTPNTLTRHKETVFQPSTNVHSKMLHTQFNNNRVNFSISSPTNYFFKLVARLSFKLYRQLQT